MIACSVTCVERGVLVGMGVGGMRVGVTGVGVDVACWAISVPSASGVALETAEAATRCGPAP